MTEIVNCFGDIETGDNDTSIRDDVEELFDIGEEVTKDRLD